MTTMGWLPLTEGPHHGKTLPEAFFTDPAHVVHGIEAGVFYSLLPNGNYSGHSVIPLNDRKFRLYAKHSVARTENCFDLLMPMRIAPKDPWSPVAMVQALKLLILGDPHAPLTREQCEGFFEDPENFLEGE